MKDLAGKTAVITGAASGIGRAMAERFGAESMNLVIADIDPNALNAAESELSAVAPAVAGHRTDVSSAADVQALADLALERFGAVHLVCNNAGVGIGGALWDMSEKDWQWLLGVNLWGVIHGVRTFVPIMLKQGGEGHVVNTASAAGLDARPWLGMYAASKYAVVGLSESLRGELAMSGSQIGVSVLCPAVVNTRIGESERNRPAGLSGDGETEVPAAAAAFGEAFRAALAAGLPPPQVAEAVLDAVLNNRLYIVTHGETVERVKTRTERILADASARPLAG
jgi:NAD(P)-dependent dehydrogenase (short-subunit alcohol dehydrogenase family)